MEQKEGQIETHLSAPYVITFQCREQSMITQKHHHPECHELFCCDEHSSHIKDCNIFVECKL